MKFGILDSVDLAILRLLSEDNTVPEVAIKLTMGERTVRAHLESLKSRLGCKTTHGLLCAAVRAGYC